MKEGAHLGAAEKGGQKAGLKDCAESVWPEDVTEDWAEPVWPREWFPVWPRE